jgi:hypothetical protein
VQVARFQGIAIAANRFHTITKPLPPLSNEPQIPRPDHT